MGERGFGVAAVQRELRQFEQGVPGGRTGQRRGALEDALRRLARGGEAELLAQVKLRPAIIGRGGHRGLEVAQRLDRVLAAPGEVAQLEQDGQARRVRRGERPAQHRAGQLGLAEGGQFRSHVQQGSAARAAPARRRGTGRARPGAPRARAPGGRGAGPRRRPARPSRPPAHPAAEASSRSPERGPAPIDLARPVATAACRSPRGAMAPWRRISRNHKPGGVARRPPGRSGSRGAPRARMQA
jgi:hypothetical protein